MLVETNKNHESKIMNNQFDELTKSMAQSVTRRVALKKFGVGLAGMALACFGLANSSMAANVKTVSCATDSECAGGQTCCNGTCMDAVPAWCDVAANPCCCYWEGKGRKNRYPTTGLSPCHYRYTQCSSVCAGLDAVG